MKDSSAQYILCVSHMSTGRKLTFLYKNKNKIISEISVAYLFERYCIARMFSYKALSIHFVGDHIQLFH